MLIPVIQTSVDRAEAKAFQSMVFHTVIGQAVHKCVSEPRIGDAAETRMIEDLAFGVLVLKFIQNQVEKSFLQKAKMD